MEDEANDRIVQIGDAAYAAAEDGERVEFTDGGAFFLMDADG